MTPEQSPHNEIIPPMRRLAQRAIDSVYNKVRGFWDMVDNQREARFQGMALSHLQLDTYLRPPEQIAHFEGAGAAAEENDPFTVGFTIDKARRILRNTPEEGDSLANFIRGRAVEILDESSEIASLCTMPNSEAPVSFANICGTVHARIVRELESYELTLSSHIELTDRAAALAVDTYNLALLDNFND